MPNTYELPLKVLWIWNCNENELAVDFLLKSDGKTYQVKGADKDTFNELGELKVCLCENIEKIYSLNPNKKVFISDGSKLKRIWTYWKEEGGEKKYNEIIRKMQEQRGSQNISLLSQILPKIDENQNIDLTRTQVYELAFEIEFLVNMQKTFKGTITENQIENLIKICCEGFLESTLSSIREELKKRDVLRG